MSNITELPCTADPELFFRGHKLAVEKAKALCRGCPRVEACLIETIEFEALSGESRHGVFGATTPQERIQLTNGKRIA